jgi:hypothetical protein
MMRIVIDKVMALPHSHSAGFKPRAMGVGWGCVIYNNRINITKNDIKNLFRGIQLPDFVHAPIGWGLNPTLWGMIWGKHIPKLDLTKHQVFQKGLIQCLSGF